MNKRIVQFRIKAYILDSLQNIIHLQMPYT